MKVKNLFVHLRHLYCWLLCGGLLVSILLNLYLLQSSRQYYWELHSTRLDPVGLLYSQYPDGLQAITASNQPRVVFFGDSRAAQWPTPTNLEQFTFINRGIGAQTSVQVAARFEQQVVPLHPQVVIVQVGINDLKTIPLFPAQQEQIITQCKAHIQQIVMNSRQIGAIVILTTIFPTGDVPLIRRPFWSPEIALAIDEVNVFIQSLQAPGVIPFDTASLLSDDSGITNRFYYQDTLHLNEQGYSRLNEKLPEFLSVAFTQLNSP